MHDSRSHYLQVLPRPREKIFFHLEARLNSSHHYIDNLLSIMRNHCYRNVSFNTYHNAANKHSLFTLNTPSLQPIKWPPSGAFQPLSPSTGSRFFKKPHLCFRPAHHESEQWCGSSVRSALLAGTTPSGPALRSQGRHPSFIAGCFAKIGRKAKWGVNSNTRFVPPCKFSSFFEFPAKKNYKWRNKTTKDNEFLECSWTRWEGTSRNTKNVRPWIRTPYVRVTVKHLSWDAQSIFYGNLWKCYS